MSRKLIRLTSQLVNTPQLITPSEGEAIYEFLKSRNLGDYQAKSDINYIDTKRDKDNSRIKTIAENGVAIIDIDGPLSYTVSEMDAFCGAVSYQQIQFDYMQAVESPDVNTILLYVDSNGGEGYGCFELSQLMRRKADENGKRLVTYVDGKMHSAALALGVSAHEVVSNPYAEQGGIGVYVKLVNRHKLNKKMGLEEHYIYAGKEKIPFNEDGDFKKEFIEDIQNKVNTLYDNFVSHVAAMTGLTEQSIKDTEARSFTSQEALSLGLIDKIMTREDFFASLSEPRTSNTPLLPAKLESKEEKSKMNEQELNALLAKLEQAEERATALEAQNEQLLKTQKEKARAELASKLSGFSFIGNDDAVLSLVSSFDAAQQEALLGAFAKAEAVITELTHKNAQLEKEDPMFTQVSAAGEQDLDADEKADKEYRVGVAQKLASKIKMTGEKQ